MLLSILAPWLLFSQTWLFLGCCVKEGTQTLLMSLLCHLQPPFAARPSPRTSSAARSHQGQWGISCQKEFPDDSAKETLNWAAGNRHLLWKIHCNFKVKNLARNYHITWCWKCLLCRLKTSCDVMISGALFGRKRLHHMMDASCWWISHAWRRLCYMSWKPTSIKEVILRLFATWH